MITYRLLAPADLPTLHNCFLAAFSDYQVDMRMSLAQFEQRLARDGVKLEISAGAFDAGKMIGFYINGLGEWQGKQTAYDAGTGVIPDYRKRGVARDLFAFLVPRLKEVAVSQYLLEVLTSNQPAVALYRKLGFVETRSLAVFRSDQPINSVRSPQSVLMRRVNKPHWELFQSFWDGYPSWQNSSDAVERVGDERVIVGAYVDDSCVGYGVVLRSSANLMQLAVAHEQRRKGIGTAILKALQHEVSEVLKVNNVDEALKGTLAFYEASGFKLVLRQFEMLKTL
jgi:ribosomal protein S18 acetylase RimI-like enzyme